MRRRRSTPPAATLGNVTGWNPTTSVLLGTRDLSVVQPIFWFLSDPVRFSSKSQLLSSESTDLSAPTAVGPPPGQAFTKKCNLMSRKMCSDFRAPGLRNVSVWNSHQQ